MKLFVIIAAIVAIGFSVYQSSLSAPAPTDEPTGKKIDTQALVDEAKSKTKKMINDLRYGKEKPDQQVTCDIEGTTRFMMESDCVTQGGRIR